ncbi:hypothetical protein QN277_003646 [Acacia crassicarpa]|uniref:Thaumatin-like protein n=1 Tax=Acacia crassicarpa TaxID=499986 RepID=A0AAE1J1Y7_9FABA|nr:hypothetical protein QN277_003646 [Acacia crassicarpa]
MASIINTSPISFLLITLFFASARAAMFNISNNCSYTVWAAALPGGGRRLNSGENWALNIAAGTSQARIWPRTNCSFDQSGRGRCLTGDCDGVLECNQTGTPPNTLAEFSLNQYNNMDFFDISLVDGFNVPLEISPNSTVCNNTIRCTGDITEQCPGELKVTGGCQNPCTVFKSDQYCCISASRNCTATTYSSFFKERCPSAYSYPKDDATSTFTCPGGTSYSVVFCP